MAAKSEAFLAPLRNLRRVAGCLPSCGGLWIPRLFQTLLPASQQPGLPMTGAASITPSLNKGLVIQLGTFHANDNARTITQMDSHYGLVSRRPLSFMLTERRVMVSDLNLASKGGVRALSNVVSTEQDGSKPKKGKKAKKRKDALKEKVGKTATTTIKGTADPPLMQDESPSTSNGLSTETSSSTLGDSNGAAAQTPAAVDESAGLEPREPSALAKLCGARVPDWLVRRAEDLGFGTPTGVQEEALPVALEGRDCVIHAQTGSGKTLTYLLPILGGIDPQRSAVQAIAVVPTRELGIQV
jgi:hypothetical protein